MMRHSVIGALLGLVLAAALGAPADAQGVGGRQRLTAEEARSAQRRGDMITTRQAIDKALARYRGAQHLNSWLERDGRNEPTEYIVQILTSNGQRLDVRVHAYSGEVLGTR